MPLLEIENLSVDFDPAAFLRQNASSTGKALGCELAVSFEVIQI